MEIRTRINESRQHQSGAGVFAHDLDLSVPGKQLLVKATMAVPVGRRAALIGRNGSGKSTLLEAICSLEGSRLPPQVELRGELKLGPVIAR